MYVGLARLEYHIPAARSFKPLFSRFTSLVASCDLYNSSFKVVLSCDACTHFFSIASFCSRNLCKAYKHLI